MNKEEWVTKKLRRRLYIDCRQDCVKYDQLLIPNDFTLHHRSMKSGANLKLGFCNTVQIKFIQFVRPLFPWIDQASKI